MPRLMSLGFLFGFLVNPLSAGEALPAGAVARMGANRPGEDAQAALGHTQSLTQLAFSPDGARLVTASKDGTVRLWETAGGKEVRLWNGFADIVVALAVSPDGQALAVADAAGAIHVFNLATGKPQRDLKGPPLPVLGWSRDTKTLLAAGRGGQVRAWTGEAASGYSWSAGQEKEGSYVALAPDCRLLVTSLQGSFSGVGGSALQVRDADDGHVLLRIDLGEPDTTADPGTHMVCWATALSPDAKYLATSQSLRTMRGIRPYLTRHRLRLWEIASGKEVMSVDSLGLAPTHLAFSPDGGRLACATADGLSKAGRIYGEPYIIVLDTLSRLELGRFHPEMGNVTCLAFSPSGKALASAGAADYSAVLWDAVRFQGNAVKPPAVAAEQITPLWEALGKDDAAHAYQSLARLIQGGDAVTFFLKHELKPVPLNEAKLIGAWLEELDSDRFQERQKAMAKLEKAGTLAESQIRQALKGKTSQEFRRRLELLLQKLQRVGPSSRELQTLRALTVLERLATPSARELLTHLATGAPEAPLTRQARLALERLR